MMPTTIASISTPLKLMRVIGCSTERQSLLFPYLYSTRPYP
jgi:hypothetical protein